MTASTDTTTVFGTQIIGRTEKALNAIGAPTSGSGRGTEPPAWAQRMQRDQRRRTHLNSTAEAIKAGDQPAGSANPDLDQES